MPFSFNPTAQSGTGQAPAATAPQESGFAPSAAPNVPLSDAPAVPSTPFLFIQQRGGDKTVGAYVQVLLMTVFVLSIVSSITLYAYSFYLKKSIESKKLLVDEAEANFKGYPYEDMKKVYTGLLTLDALLKEYASARTPLLLLEKVVENEVLFSNFTLSRETTGKYTMRLTAVTSNYKVLVQQLEALKLASYAKVAPSQKINKIEEAKQNKNGQIEVEIMAPLNIQGIHPDSVIFENIVDVGRQMSTTTQPVNTVNNDAQASSTIPN